MNAVGGVAVSMFLFLLLGGVPLACAIILLISSRRRGNGFPACGGCGYNLSASIGATPRCPECGAEFATVGIQPPRTPRDRVKLWVGLTLLIFNVTCVGFLGLGLVLPAVAAARASAARLQAQQAAAVAQAAAPVTTTAPDSIDESGNDQVEPTPTDD